MSWKKEIEEIKLRRSLALQLGGKEKVKRQHNAGRLTVRERISYLLDKKSFYEVGMLAGRSTYTTEGDLKNILPSNSIIGHGTINNEPVVVYGDDFTIRGGASDAAIWEKMIAAEKLANEYEIPIIRLIEGTGGGGSIKSLEKDGYSYVPANPGWDLVVDNLTKVPVISLALGPVAGLGAARLVSSHLSVMVKGLSQVFVAGPPLVEKVGEKVTKEELGGYGIHSKNGVVDNVTSTEKEAMDKTKLFLSYMPRSVFEIPKFIRSIDPPDRKDKYLIDIIPKNKRESYEIMPIIKSVLDKDTFFEIGENYGLSVITGMARLNGYPLVVIANNPQVYGGGWTADASKKIIKILDLAQTFHFPIIHLVDNPGFVVGKNAEKNATIRYGAKALAAIYQINVPMCTILLRKAFGVAGAANTNHIKYRYRLAWPSGDWGSLPFEGGIEAAYKTELAKSDNPKKLKENIVKSVSLASSPFRTAEKFLVEDIIDPSETRAKVCQWIKLAYPTLKTGLSYFGYRP